MWRFGQLLEGRERKQPQQREENRDRRLLERVGGRRVLGLGRGAGRELLGRQTALHVGFGERAHADHGVERV